MGTVVVWVLLISMSGYQSEASMTVIDNIASRQNCEGLRVQAEAAARRSALTVSSRCVAVRKIAPVAAPNPKDPSNG